MIKAKGLGAFCVGGWCFSKKSCICFVDWGLFLYISELLVFLPFVIPPKEFNPRLLWSFSPLFPHTPASEPRSREMSLGKNPQNKKKIKENVSYKHHQTSTYDVAPTMRRKRSRTCTKKTPSEFEAYAYFSFPAQCTSCLGLCIMP